MDALSQKRFFVREIFLILLIAPRRTQFVFNDKIRSIRRGKSGLIKLVVQFAGRIFVPSIVLSSYA